MTRALLKSLLDHEFYQENRPRLRESIFSSDDAEAYRLIAKGHEKYQEINGERFPFDDIQVLQEMLQIIS